jgi:hypothetical protein
MHVCAYLSAGPFIATPPRKARTIITTMKMALGILKTL